MWFVELGSRLYRTLDAAQQNRAKWLIPMMVLKALMETLGTASILPFVAVVASPEAALQNRYLGFVYEILGFQSITGFLVMLGCASLVVLLLSNVLSVTASYRLQQFAMNQRHLIQTRMVAINLALPYATFLNRNTADIGEEILNEISEVVEGVLLPYLNLIARAVATLALFGLLVIVNPVLALVSASALGISYYLVFRFVRMRIRRLGGERVVVDGIRYRTIAEAYDGIKDVKVTGRESTYLDTFYAASKRSAALAVAHNLMNIAPKAGLEVVAFGGIIVIVIFLIWTGGTTAAVLSTVALYAFASYRLLPAVQQMYEAVTQLRYSLPSLRILERHLAEAVGVDVDFEPRVPLALRSGIELTEVGFVYPGAVSASLERVDISIPCGSTVALVGSTGSGKTTTLDLILGLFQPTTGHVLVDGAPLTQDRVRAWQAGIGYVPQHVFLSDDTIARNIAFGVPAREIDRDRLMRAATIAQIHDFIVNQPDGFDTQVGERGVKLSGGQRQRLGIARAIYRNPPVLVLDEATSALDSITESALFEALSTSASGRTTILVAHRLSTVRNADVIYVLEKGSVVARGNYAALMETSRVFRDLAQQQRQTAAIAADS
jgi:ABC-type multidrug transport system fused ATPase/permease subunit